MLTALVLFVSMSFAEEKIPVKEGFQTMDMNQFNKIDKPIKGSSNFKVTTGCKTKAGVEYKSTDAGYSACLREADLEKNVQKNGATPTTNIQFGN